jgi:CheY-like chemotaxis protein
VKFKADAQAAGARGTVLIVDDEPLVLKVISTALTRSGYSCLKARHPREALSLWESSNVISVLVVDYILPGTDGLTLARRLQAMKPSVGVVITSTPMHEALLRLPESFRFLPKPFECRELLAVIAAAGGRSAAVTAGA